jgi:hypothetical protein
LWWVFLKQGFENYLHGLTSSLEPPDVCLILILKDTFFTLVLLTNMGVNEQGSILQTGSVAVLCGAYICGLQQLFHKKVSFQIQLSVNSDNRVSFLSNKVVFLSSGAECSHLFTLVIITA